MLSVNPPYPSRDNSGVDPTDGCDEAVEAAQKGEQLAAGQERHESQTGRHRGQTEGQLTKKSPQQGQQPHSRGTRGSAAQLIRAVYKCLHSLQTHLAAQARHPSLGSMA